MSATLTYASKPPLSLSLLTTKVDAPDGGSGIRAQITNHTDAPVVYLGDATMWNHSKLVVKSASGALVEPNDIRTVASTTWTATIPKRDHFVKIKPGETKTLHEAVVSMHDGGHYSITWGPYVYNLVPEDSYTVTISWTGSNEYLDQKEKKRKLEEAWVGRLSSPSIRLDLPGRGTR